MRIYIYIWYISCTFPIVTFATDVRMYLLHRDHYVPQSDVHSYKWTLFNLLNTLTVMKGYGNFNKTFQLAFQITWYPGRFLSGTCFSNTFLMAWGHSVWVIYIYSSLMNTNILCILGCISTKMWPFNPAAMFVNKSFSAVACRQTNDIVLLSRKTLLIYFRSIGLKKYNMLL